MPRRLRSASSEHPHLRQLPRWLGGAMVGGTLIGLLYLERKYPLRRDVEPKLRHHARNLAVASLTAAAVHFIEQPLMAPLARRVQQRRLGLLKRFNLPVWLDVTLAFLLLDYTLYLWHVLVHKAPLLWRFHLVHHTDLDLDTTTGIRFHFGEIVISILWRAVQVLLIGVSPLALSVWQTLLLMSVMFHHSNTNLPPRVERWLSLILVTPRMHGIHHSTVKGEADSNWSSGLSIWDRLHRTFRLDVPQERITIGVPAYRDPKELTLPRLVEMPFVEQRPTWRAGLAGASGGYKRAWTNPSPTRTADAARTRYISCRGSSRRVP